MKLRPANCSKTYQKKDIRAKTNDIDSLDHTNWNCKYHTVSTPKYRRKVAYGNMRVEIGKILRGLCNWKGAEIIQAEVCPDHIHMLVKIPSKISVLGLAGFPRGKNTLSVFERHTNLKYKYGNRTFWCRRYSASTVGKNDRAIVEYIKNQLAEDQIKDQMTLKEYVDPFTGSKQQTLTNGRPYQRLEASPEKQGLARM